MIGRLFILFMLMIFSGCNQKTREYILRGNIKGLPDGMIYIQVLTDSGFHFIDSAVIRQHSFLCKGITAEPKMITLLFRASQGNEFLCSSFFLENELINITGDLSDRSKIKISSSPENNAMKEISQRAQRPKRYYLLQNLIYKHQQNLYKSSDDSIPKWKVELQQIDTVYKKQLFKVILSHKSNYVALYTLLSELYLFSIDELKIMGQAFTIAIQQSNSYKPLAGILKLAKSVNIGERFENFSLPDSLQQRCSLSNVSRPFVLIEFWASWCGPCRKQLPELKKIYAAANQNKLSIISISIDEDTTAWKKALKEEEMPWLNLLSAEKDWSKSHYLITSVPACFLLDSNRNIIAKNISPYEVGKYVNGYRAH